MISILVCVYLFPESIDSEGPSGVERSPEITRPITLSNTDSKIVCGLLNLSLAKAAEALCDHPQRGFIKGRNPSDNILGLDGFPAFQDVLPRQPRGMPRPLRFLCWVSFLGS